AVEGQRGGVDAGGVEVPAAAEQGRVLVDGLEVGRFRARFGGGDVGAGGEQGARVGIVVEDAGRAGAGPGQVVERARERVRRPGRRGVGVADAAALELEDVGQVALQVEVGDVGLGQAVHRPHQDVLGGYRHAHYP